MEKQPDGSGGGGGPNFSTRLMTVESQAAGSGGSQDMQLGREERRIRQVQILDVGKQGGSLLLIPQTEYTISY